MKRIIKAIYWRLVITRLAWRWIFIPTLGDMVIFNGKKYRLNQGVRSPIWSLVREGEYIEVHEKDFQRVIGIKAWWRSFNSGYRFYMWSWYGIWMDQGIQPWMQGANIWGGGKPMSISPHPIQDKSDQRIAP
jgi:hypothetical protein